VKIKPGTPYWKVARSADNRKWEDLLLFQIKAEGLQIPIPEYQFAKNIGRKWRFDFAYPNIKLGIECEGAIFAYGRHNRPTGFQGDLHKYNCAALLGWIVLRYSSEDIKNYHAINEIKNVFIEIKNRIDSS